MAKRGKGSAFERIAAVELSKWWSRKEDEDLFWRTHGSGNRATMRSKTGKKTGGQYGDLTAVDSRGATLFKAVTISLKRGYAGISLQDVADQFATKKTPSQFETWVKEVIRDARLAKSIAWLLIVRKNRRRALVFMPISFIFKFDFLTTKKLMDTTPSIMFRMENKVKKTKRMSPSKYLRRYLRNNAVIFGIRLEDFLRIVKRDDIVNLVRRNKHG